MNKTFYSEYVKHCLKFYAKHPRPIFHSEANKKNWNACDNALKTFSDFDKDILTTVYSEGDSLADNVYQMAKSKGINQDTIWTLIGELERKVAKRRGLL